MINEHPCAAEWLALNDYGLSTFPLRPGQKTPLASWTAYQTRRATEEELACWLTDGTAYNIAIATGGVSGIVVVDLDSPEAETYAEQQGLPPTPEVKTPRGRHVYFRHPGHDMRNTAGKLADKIDFRGDGGYVVAPGSYYIPTHEQAADGKTEGAYEWVAGRTPNDLPFAELPAWCVPVPPQPMVSPLPAPIHQSPPTSRAGVYAAKALANECDAVRFAPAGTRNHALNRSAFAVGQLVAGELLDATTARHELETAAVMAGLSRSEIATTIDSGWKSGAKHPRSMPDDDDVLPGNAPRTPSPAPHIDWFTGADATMATPREREWLIDGWLPIGATTLLTGDGGMGKTLIAQQMASAIAAGQPIWGNRTTQAPVMALYCEDDRDELNRRQRAINQSMTLTQHDVSTSHMASGFGMSALLGSFDRTNAYQTNELFGSIRDRAILTGARLVIIDNINMVFGDNINDPARVAAFVSALNGLALELDGAVLLLGHVAKAEGSRSAGTAAWVNGVRNHLFLSRPENMTEAAKHPDLRHLTRNKSNYASTGERLDLTWERGAFVDASSLAGNGRTLEQVSDDKRFLSALDSLTESKVALSINPRARSYAPRVMTEKRRDALGSIPQSPIRYPKEERAMGAAMARLLADGTILPDEPLGWRKADRKAASGIKRAIDRSTALLEALQMPQPVEVDPIAIASPAAPPARIVRATPPALDLGRSDKVKQMVAMLAERRQQA